MSNIRVVIVKDSDTWVGQCLDDDVCVHKARSQLEVALNTEAPFTGLPKAPARFFDLWDWLH